jgi:ubiquinone/menaquinone biosynthesis C-methylase UbiE
MNVFDVDKLRQDLAKSKKINDLKETYNGKYPELSDISTAEKWDALADNNEIPEIRVKRLEMISTMIDTNKKILDVGAGWGDIIPILLRENPDLRYTGIDFSSEIISRLEKKYPHLTFCHCNLQDITEKYDIIIILQVLEHIIPSNVFSFLKDAYNILNDDGTLIADIPYCENIKNTTYICGKCGSFVNRMGHVRSYSPELLTAELQIAGFSVEEIRYVYEGYYGLSGTIKRHIRNIAGMLIGPNNFQKVQPISVAIKCKK